MKKEPTDQEVNDFFENYACKINSTKPDSEKLMSLPEEMKYVAGIVRNIRKEQTDARERMGLLHLEQEYFEMWVDALCIMTDKSLTNEQIHEKLNNKYIIMTR